MELPQGTYVLRHEDTNLQEHKPVHGSYMHALTLTQVRFYNVLTHFVLMDFHPCYISGSDWFLDTTNTQLYEHNMIKSELFIAENNTKRLVMIRIFWRFRLHSTPALK